MTELCSFDQTGPQEHDSFCQSDCIMPIMAMNAKPLTKNMQLTLIRDVSKFWIFELKNGRPGLHISTFPAPQFKSMTHLDNLGVVNFSYTFKLYKAVYTFTKLQACFSKTMKHKYKKISLGSVKKQPTSMELSNWNILYQLRFKRCKTIYAPVTSLPFRRKCMCIRWLHALKIERTLWNFGNKIHHFFRGFWNLRGFSTRYSTESKRLY